MARLHSRNRAEISLTRPQLAANRAEIRQHSHVYSQASERVIMQSLQASRQDSRFIVVARWVAAFAVLIAHAGSLFISQSDIMTAPHGPGAYVWWFLTGFPHQAVIIFFVISGFLVGGNVIEKSRSTEPFLAKYFADRTVRIYLVLIPVILLGWCLDTVGRYFLAGFGLYDAPMFAGSFDLRLLGPNLLNLQGIFFPTFGTNGPLWSLGCEFWYYIAWALLLLPLTQSAPLVRLIGFAFGAALAVSFSISGVFFFVGGLIWIAGALVRFMPRPLIRSKGLALFIFLAVTAAVRLIVRGKIPSNPVWAALADAAVALSFCNLLLSLRFSQSKEWALCNWRIHKPLSDFSFSLYACHLPIIVFAAAAADYAFGLGWRSQLPGDLHWVVTFGLLALTLCAAWLLSCVTEARTEDARLAVYRVIDLIGRRRARVHAIADESRVEQEPVPASAA
jgi:peptidoglycan/LPS O-acetylase OafA/YrhL